MDFLASIFLISSLFSCNASNIMSKFVQPKCINDSVCGLNAYCKDKIICACKAGYLPANHNSTLCVKEAVAIGDPCTEEIQCTAAFGTKAECFKEREGVTGSCRCKNGAHFEDKICYPSTLIGGLCHASAECKASSNVSTFCDAGKCVCEFNYHPSRDRTDCLQSSHIGDRCHNDEYCVTSNSQCNGNICRCKSRTILSYDSKHCLPVAEGLGEACQEDSQCQEYLRNTICNSLSQVCTCSPTATFKDGYCWSVADLDDVCYDTRECIIKSQNSAAVVCSNQICSCVAGFKADLQTNDCISSSGSSSHDLIRRQEFKLIILFHLIVFYLIKNNLK